MKYCLADYANNADIKQNIAIYLRYLREKTFTGTIRDIHF